VKLWIWFDPEEPYYCEQDCFNSIAEAEEFWYDDPFFISAETAKAEPPIVPKFRRTIAKMYRYPTRREE